MKRVLVWAVAGWLALGSLTAAEEAGVRPVLIRKQGQCFSWALPKGWTDSESVNGVDINSPDRRQNAASCLLLRNPGRSTPEQFARRITQMLRLSDFKITKSTRLPDQVPNVVTAEIEFTCTDLVHGPRRGGATVAISQAYGQHGAFWQWYTTSPDRWEQDKLWLPAIARGVKVTNPTRIAGNDTIIQPRNNPLDNSSLIKSWEAKKLSQDRISQATREGTMGYERMKSPASGRLFEMPLETYDGAKGGYQNPEDPTEILQRALPGE